MGSFLMILLVAVSVVSLVCWIMTLIKIFKVNIGLGILGIICGLFAFIYGWIKAVDIQAIQYPGQVFPPGFEKIMQTGTIICCQHLIGIRGRDRYDLVRSPKSQRHRFTSRPTRQVGLRQWDLIGFERLVHIWP